MTKDQAEIIGLNALAWLAGNDELLPVFLGSTGADQNELSARAAEPEFLGSVLEFLTMDDHWITAFCDASGIAYDVPMRANQVLGGTPHWT